MVDYSDESVYCQVVDAEVAVSTKTDRLYRFLFAQLIVIALASVAIAYWLDGFFALATVYILWTLVVFNAKSRDTEYQEQLDLVRRWALCQEMLTASTQLILAHDSEFYEDDRAQFDCGQLSISLSKMMMKTPVGGPALCLYNHLISYLHAAQRVRGLDNEEFMNRILDDSRLAKFVELTAAQAGQYEEEIVRGPIRGLMTANLSFPSPYDKSFKEAI